MRRRVFVTGTVQGVFFRESTRRQAEGLGVRGWVKNLPDGRVEAVFEGSDFGVQQMVEWCHHGPGRAHVRHVEALDEDEEGIDGFTVIR